MFLFFFSISLFLRTSFHLIPYCSPQLLSSIPSEIEYICANMSIFSIISGTRGSLPKIITLQNSPENVDRKMILYVYYVISFFFIFKILFLFAGPTFPHFTIFVSSRCCLYHLLHCVFSVGDFTECWCASTEKDGRSQQEKGSGTYELNCSRYF